MSSALSPLQEPLRLTLRRSNSLLLYLMLVHVMAALASVYAARDYPWLQFLMPVLLAGIFCYYYLNNYMLRLAQSVRGIRVSGECVTLSLANGSEQHGVLGRRHFVAPWLVVLGVVPLASRRQRHIAVFPDAIAEVNSFRRLRVQLRFRPSSKANSSAA